MAGLAGLAVAPARFEQAEDAKPAADEDRQPTRGEPVGVPLGSRPLGCVHDGPVVMSAEGARLREEAVPDPSSARGLHPVHRYWYRPLGRGARSWDERAERRSTYEGSDTWRAHPKLTGPWHGLREAPAARPAILGCALPSLPTEQDQGLALRDRTMTRDQRSGHSFTAGQQVECRSSALGGLLSIAGHKQHGGYGNSPTGAAGVAVGAGQVSGKPELDPPFKDLASLTGDEIRHDRVSPVALC